MAELTREQMEDACFARFVALCADGVPVTGDRDEDARIAEKVERGKKVLERYSLRYTPRFTVLSPEIARNDVAGMLKVDAGHIATSPAYRLAVFKVRQ